MRLFISLFMLLMATTPLLPSQLSIRNESNFYSQFAVQYGLEPFTLWQQPLQLKVAYATTRLKLFPSNVLPKDDFRLSLAWLFLQHHQLQAYLQTDVGHTAYEIQHPAFSFLDNDAWTWAILLGAYIPLGHPAFGVDMELGYALLLSSTVNPLTFSLGLRHDL